MRWLAFVLCMLAAPLAAVQPDEILDDTALELRARDLSVGLRCPVCRNESIDESNAGISRDLRILLRERLVAGDTDEEAVQYLVDRYGDYILLSPPIKGVNLALWFAAPIMLLLAGGIAVATIRGRSRAAVPEALSAEEQARIDKIMRS
ncbi:UNVERIFIED_CONTAM: hypothetical protein GTU68_036660 [Idotea baltica]|nr:hypothetical protein [Idotea baltica]